MLIIPIQLAEGENWGVISFADCQNERQWAHLEMSTLKAAAAIIGAAINRHNAQQSLDASHMRQIEEINEALVESNDRLQVVTNMAKDGIIMLDGKGKVTFWNPGAEDIFGYSTGKVLGLDLHSLFSKRGDYEHFQQRFGYFLRQIKKNPDRMPGNTREFTVLRKNGKEIIVEISFSGSYAPNGFSVVCVCRDVTERRRIEATAARNAHLAALGTITAGVAHEINNPNNFIMINGPLLADMCQATMPIVEEYALRHDDMELAGFSFREYRELAPQLLAGIIDGSERIKTIVQHLKEFSRQHCGENFAPFNINDMVKKAVMLCGSQLKKYTREFTVDFGRDLPLVLGNPGQVEQVVINLLMNAAEALPSPDRKIRLETFTDREAGIVGIRVEDEGCGITSEHMSNVMNPFFTTKQDSGGTGLGLSISYSIMKSHQGELFFDSQPGKGTVATVRLPGLKSEG